MKLSHLIIPLLLFSLPVFADTPEPITDGKVIGISMTTNQIQIKGSQYSYPRVQYFDLKNFANAMLVDYQNYERIMEDFVYKTGISPELSKIAHDIEERGNVVLQEIAKLKGRELEKRYIDAEVELHEKTLDSIDRLFLPNVSNPELRNLVEGIRPTIQSRLEWALRIQAYYGSL